MITELYKERFSIHLFLLIADKISTLVTNTRELNNQMKIRKLSLTKEIQELFKKINAIFQVLNLDDRLDDFNIEKKKEIEYEITKTLALLEVHLNLALSEYAALKNPTTNKQPKSAGQTPSPDKVKPSAVKEVAKRNEESVLPVVVEDIRKERYVSPIVNKERKQSREFVGISRKSTSSNKSASSNKSVR